MTKFVTVDTPGGTIWVEVDHELEDDTLTLTSVSENASKSLVEATDSMKKNAKFILDKVISLGPDEVEISFGIKLGIEGGTPFFGLAKASGEANYVINMKWTRLDASENDLIPD